MQYIVYKSSIYSWIKHRKWLDVTRRRLLVPVLENLWNYSNNCGQSRSENDRELSVSCYHIIRRRWMRTSGHSSWKHSIQYLLKGELHTLGGGGGVFFFFFFFFYKLGKVFRKCNLRALLLLNSYQNYRLPSFIIADAMVRPSGWVLLTAWSHSYVMSRYSWLTRSAFSESSIYDYPVATSGAVASCLVLAITGISL